MRRKQVVVIGNYDPDSPFQDIAYLIGKEIAVRGFVLVTGGRTGIMESAAKGAFEAGGIAVAILPGNSFDDANPYCDIVIPTGIGYARNSANVLAGDLIISISGGSGTLSELAYAWQYKKRIVACSFTGGWSESLAGTSIDNRRHDFIIDARNMDDVIKELDRLKKA